jgi:hypothetical protein
VVLATLPFMWSEDVSCDGKPQQLLTGLQILFGKAYDDPAPGLVFFLLLVVGIALAFLATLTNRPGRRLGAELVASVAALGNTFLCVLMMTHGRPSQTLDRPAAWIGTLAALGITIQAWFTAGAALRTTLEAWRARRSRRRAEITAEKTGLRIGAPEATAPTRPVDEDDAVDEDAELEADHELAALKARVLRRG